MGTIKRTATALIIALGMIAAILLATALTARADAVTVRLSLDAASQEGVTIRYGSQVITKTGVSATIPDGTGSFQVTVEPDTGYEFSSPAMTYYIYSANNNNSGNAPARNTPPSTAGAIRYTISPISIAAYNVHLNFEDGGSVVFKFTGVKKIGDTGAVDFPADPTLPGGDDDATPVTPAPVTPDPVTPTPVMPSPAVSGFIDVQNSSSYYYRPVYWAVEKKITEGTTTTTFSPGNDCTRGQVVTFLWRAFGSPQVNGTTAFFDISPNAFYFDAIFWAVHSNVTEGTGPGTFSPNAPCTRAQVVTFLYRACGSPAVTGSASNFRDVPASSYYYNAVAWAVANGITEGTSTTTFSPATVCTRAQVVTFLYRCLENGTTPAPTPAPAETKVAATDVSLSYSHAASSVEGYTDNMGNTYTGGYFMYSGRRLLDEPTGDVTFSTNGAYKRLTGTVAIRDTHKNCPECGSIQIYGDGKLLFDSGAMVRGSRPVAVDVDVTDVRTVTLTINQGEWHSDSTAFGSCEFVSAYFYK